MKPWMIWTVAFSIAAMTRGSSPGWWAIKKLVPTRALVQTEIFFRGWRGLFWCSQSGPGCDFPWSCFFWWTFKSYGRKNYWHIEPTKSVNV
jgi:hypothetical protein